MILAAAMPLYAATLAARAEPASLVRPMMGTGAAGCVVPVAAAPFGMVQLGPDTYFTSSGYHYDHDVIYGFSHTHKSGGGGTDFQDIMFFPVAGSAWQRLKVYPDRVGSRFSHEREHVEPGYYRVRLLDSDIEAELTATSRCGMHRYAYPDGAARQLIVDLKHGCQHSTTIFADEDFDTVKVSRLEWVDERTVRGFRISNGWAPEQHVYFYAEFSEPIRSCRFFDRGRSVEGIRELEGTDVRAVLNFGGRDGRPLVARVGISPVSMEGARENLSAEIKGWNFDRVRSSAYSAWNEQLSAVRIEGGEPSRREVFYTSLYYAMLYPMLYSDVTGEYRSSDSKVYRGDFRYFAGVLSLWDTFRAQNPLIAILRPDVTRDLMKTMLEHYRHCGQLPIWTLAGVENMCMIGYHSMPVIADAYSKGIRDFDAEALYEAMKASSDRDTFGYFLKAFRGARHYNRYGYVPCDLEITSVSKTLEYCYDDWCIAQMARMLGREEDYERYIERAGRYRNLFDSSLRFMRGRLSDGSWRTPFDPFLSNHYREGDDFCEGTSWQWTFFVPHDGKGLIDLFGGRELFVAKLDSLFTVSSEIHGDNPAPDITGLIGQYAQGNEPGHHTLYMYNYAGEPWKAQRRIADVLYTLYDVSPEGICGNDDTGQMSAWYVMSSMGFYPVTHGRAVYFVGTPIFPEVKLRHGRGVLTVRANGVSRENRYIQSASLNGRPFTKNWLSHEELFGGDATLTFEMGARPNRDWGSSPGDLPQSMCDEAFAE